MSDNVIVWRGYGCQNDTEIDSLRNKLRIEGDKEEKKSWLRVPTISHHRNCVDEIIERILEEGENITRYDTSENGLVGKYVCGDTIGATHYALREYGKGMIVEINVPIERLLIDGRDFLYTIVPRIIGERIEWKKNWPFADAFGEKIIEYLEKGVNLKNYPLNMMHRYVDFICMDLDIINNHLKSNVLIKGRYGTKFKSAFAIIGGIEPQEMKEIFFPKFEINDEYGGVLDISEFH